MKSKVLIEAYRLSEERLQAQSKFSLASDQRSLVFSGVSIAAAALTAGLISSGAQNIAFYISVGFFLLSSAFAVISAMPSAVHVPGNNFADTMDSINDDEGLDVLLDMFGRGNDKKILENEKRQKKSIDLYRISICFFIFACVFLFVNLWMLGHL